MGLSIFWRFNKLLDRYHHGRRVSNHNINNTIMLSEARHHHFIIAIKLRPVLKEICSPLLAEYDRLPLVISRICSNLGLIRMMV